MLRLTFWSTNIGLAFMFILTLLPVGVLQVLDNVNHGYWHARSNAFWDDRTVQILGQIRLLPDALMVFGSATLLLFVVKALRGLKPVEVKEGEPFTKP